MEFWLFFLCPFMLYITLKYKICSVRLVQFLTPYILLIFPSLFQSLYPPITGNYLGSDNSQSLKICSDTGRGLGSSFRNQGRRQRISCMLCALFYFLVHLKINKKIKSSSRMQCLKINNPKTLFTLFLIFPNKILQDPKCRAFFFHCLWFLD